MPDTPDQTPLPPEDDGAPPTEGELGDYGIEGDEPRDAPRRAASAEFVVDGQLGSQAGIREAMDPAHQSLADALRLSYRVLQIVMIVLIVLFAFSGIETVDEGQTGVMTRWGRIRSVDGDEALAPGIHFSVWPYPVGEYVVFDDKGRSTDVGSMFWPGIREGRDLEEMIDETSQGGTILKPGRDGYLLTADGDIGHLRLGAAYRIDGVADFVTRVDDADEQRNADAIVQRALEQAAVHTVARMQLKDVVDLDDATRAAIRTAAQSMLDELDCGIMLSDVQTPDSRAALAIENQFRDAQSARIEADRTVRQARQSAEESLIEIAGENWAEALALIEEFERASESGDEAATEERMEGIRDWFDGERLGGRVASIVLEAKGYGSMVELTLGDDVRQFRDNLDAYRKNPELTVASLWLEAYASVLNGEDVEIIRVPNEGGSVVLRLNGSSAVQDIRTDRRLRDRESSQLSAGFGPGTSFSQRRENYRLDSAQRQLNVDDGRVSSKGGQ